MITVVSGIDSANMSSFMIFDQSSKLVYLNYDQRFARLVSELILGADAEKCLDTAELKEWIVFYLSQHVEMNRTEEAEYDVSTLEPLEHFLVARKMVRRWCCCWVAKLMFVFIEK